MELMIKEKKEFKKTDLGYVPDEWKVYKFGDLILDMKGGASLSKRNYIDHGIKVIPKGGVGRGGLLNVDKEDQNYCSYEYYKKHLNNAVDKKYTIIVLRDLVPSGPNIGLMVNIESDETYILAQGVYGFRVNPELTIPEYLVHLSNSNQYRKLMQSILVGSTQVHVRNTTLKNVEIPLPSTLAEQHAIASALSDVDELIRSLNGLIQKKHAIKKGTMQQLLSGKKRLPGFDGEWEVKKLGELLLESPDYGINAPAVDYNSNYPTYLRITDISKNGRFLKEDKKSVKAVNSGMYYLNEGEIVLARTGASTGKSYHYDPKDGELVFAGFLIRIKPNPKKLISHFLKYFLQTDKYWNWVKTNSMRSGQPGLNSFQYSSLEILTPSLEEQKAIAQILSDMDREFQSLRQKREKYVHIKQGMMQELLTGKVRLV